MVAVSCFLPLMCKKTDQLFGSPKKSAKYKFDCFVLSWAFCFICTAVFWVPLLLFLFVVCADNTGRHYFFYAAKNCFFCLHYFNLIFFHLFYFQFCFNPQNLFKTICNCFVFLFFSALKFLFLFLLFCFGFFVCQQKGY